MKKAKIITASALLLTACLSYSDIPYSFTALPDKIVKKDDFGNRKNHYTLDMAYYEKNHDYTIKAEFTYVKQKYCYQSAIEYWRDYWSDPVKNSKYDLITICRSVVNHYKFKRIECDENMTCNV